MNREVRARLETLLSAARRLVDPNAAGADAWRERLRASSGLSRAGVDLALAQCLEVEPSEAELEALVESVEPAPRSHVLLSANVFVAAHRAIALALAASPEVCVRASRREPEMAGWLAHEAPGLFRLQDRLEPRAGEQLFAYGNATTLAELSRSLRRGARLHGHGPGFGLWICHESALESAEQRQRLATELALDIVLFDQRGCLSPRAVLLQGSEVSARKFASALGAALDEWESRVPRGELSSEEREESARYAATLAYAGELVPAGLGVLGIAPAESALTLPPAGRNLHLLPVANATTHAATLAPHVTTFAVSGSWAFEAAIAQALPHARPARLGLMQRPAFDGPVDRRPATHSAPTTFFNPIGRSSGA